jgi:hypothetical protein
MVENRMNPTAVAVHFFTQSSEKCYLAISRCNSQTFSLCVGYRILTAATAQSAVTPCNLVQVNRHIGGTNRLSVSQKTAL